MKLLFVFLIISFSFLTCTIPVDYVQKNGRTFLSIEGGISDQLERQTIKLTNTSTKIDNTAIFAPVNGAKIFISDEKGATFNFVETENGIYQTKEKMAGHLGGTYQLHMTVDGKIYESEAENMIEAPPIDSLSYQINVNSILPETNDLKVGFDVYLNFKDSPEKGNYYRWTWKGFNQLNVCFVNNRIIYHCGEPCFDVSYSETINILSDDYINGQEVSQVFITRVPRLLNEYYSYITRYFLQVEQRALSRHTYSLFRELKNSQNGGTLFDVPALTKFNLNINCLNDPSQKILGVFEVYSVKKKFINIKLDTEIDGLKINYTPVQGEECRPLPCSGPCVEGFYRTKTAPEGY